MITEISSFLHTRDNRPVLHIWSWLDFCNFLADCASVPRHPDEKADTPAISPAIYRDGDTRRKASVIKWGAWAAFDIDNNVPGVPAVSFHALESRLISIGLAYVLHTTTKSTDSDHRLRLILPLSRPIMMDEFDAFWMGANQWLGGGTDRSTSDPNRIFYIPAQWEGANNLFTAMTSGTPLDVDTLPKPAIPVRAASLSSPLNPHRHRALKHLPVNAITDLFTSPLLTSRAIQAFAQSPQGGRLFRLMCSIVGRAEHLGYLVTPEDVTALALAVDSLIGPPKSRHNALREAQNAMDYVRQSGVVGG